MTFRVNDLLIDITAAGKKRPRPHRDPCRGTSTCGNCTVCSMCSMCSMCSGCSVCSRASCTQCSMITGSTCDFESLLCNDGASRTEIHSRNLGALQSALREQLAIADRVA
jgi:hypothetical protein